VAGAFSAEKTRLLAANQPIVIAATNLIFKSFDSHFSIARCTKSDYSQFFLKVLPTNSSSKHLNSAFHANSEWVTR
jgi:hypothetical protein